MAIPIWKEFLHMHVAIKLLRNPFIVVHKMLQDGKLEEL